MVRTPGYVPCSWYAQTGLVLERRILKPTMNTVIPCEILINPEERPSINKKPRSNKFYSTFPRLNGSVLCTAPDIIK